MNKNLLAFTFCLITTCSLQAQKQLTRYVNPFIGTAPLTDPSFIGYTPPEGWRVWAGLTFPGAALPNAMVQLSPITEWHSGAGYEYEDEMILGFTHTNKGHWNLCNIPFLPVTGNVAPGDFASHFSHENESAQPGYYQVFLERYGIHAELTSTLRCGYHKYSFPEGREKKLVVNLAVSNEKVVDWGIGQDGVHGFRGYQQARDKIYFYAESNLRIQHIESLKEGRGEISVISFMDSPQPLEIKVGLSFVSVENARENLQKELSRKSFEQVKNEASEIWEKLLSKIDVAGGSERQKMLFYSSLYRSFLWPALRSDVNGEFTNESGKVVKRDFRYYTLPSLWDTYRNKLVLLGLLAPDVTNDVIRSVINRGEKTGFIPTFFHGDHAAPFITGAYLRGIKRFDIRKAYQLLLNNAYKEGGTRPHITEYIKKGYISDPDVERPRVETKAKAGVSKTLEYAYDDYSLAQLARALNDSVHYQDLMKRSQNYRNVFDASTLFLRGRLDDGSWITPFDPRYPYYEYMYREANAWQVSFYVPHDMPGLAELYGGKAGFEEKLDSLFTLPWNPGYIARNVSSFIGQYCHGNQPDHEAPFAYYFAGKPWKSQQVIDNILENFYGVGEEGLALCGMDDAGEMSSWYVFCSLGLYPLSPADPEYLVTVPAFDKISWKLENGKTLTIKKRGKGRKLAGIAVNGRKQTGYFVLHDLFLNGGTLEVRTRED